MALALTLSRVHVARSLAPALGSRSRTMMIRAFKDDKGQQEKSQPQQEVQRQDMTTAPARTEPSEARLATRGTPFELMPFRRMTDSLAQMQREMDALMDFAGFGSDIFRSPFSLLTAAPRMAGAMNRLVPYDVQEDETKYTVRMEVPGFTKNDIKVSLDPTTNTLTVSGQTNTEGKDERRAMSFTRSFSLPQDLDTDKQVSARTEHGVLTVELPKSPEPQRPQVKEITVEGA